MNRSSTALAPTLLAALVFAPAAAPAAQEATTSAAVQPAAPPPSPGGLAVDDKGVALRGPGNSFVLKFKATLQADGRKYFDDASKDNVLMRRVRPILDGTVLDLVDFFVNPDFADSRAVLFDAYIDVHPARWLRLRVGKFKAPVGLERLQKDPDLPFIERALTADLSSVRDVGAQLWGEVAGGLFTYQLGIFNGSPDSGQLEQDTGRDKDFAGRLLVTPLARLGVGRLGSLGLGVAATTGVRSGSARATNLLPLRTVGQTAFFSYLAPGTNPTGEGTVFAQGRHERLNPQLHYFIGALGLLSDVIWSRQNVQKGSGETARLTHSAWHATASYVLGGRNSLDGATPNAAWNPAEGHLGALELAFRYQALRVDDGAFPVFADPLASARGASGFGVSANWVLSRIVRFAAGYEQTAFEGGGGAEGVDRPTEQVLFARSQLNF